MACPRRVFLLWLQGWDQAPEIVRRVRDSWVFHNPSWEVVCLDVATLPGWIDASILAQLERHVTRAAASDIIRLHLLKDHGGVWADATMLCVRPLDSWVDDAVAREGFWMYHGRDSGRGPASWFMVSLPESLIASKWAEAAREFWASAPTRYEYFWMDRLFSRLAQSDPEFLASWTRVPNLSCESPGSAHALAGRVYDPPDHAVLQSIRETVPFAIKLDWRGNFQRDTNAWHVIDWAFAHRECPPVSWQEPPCFARADFFTTLAPRWVLIDCGTHFGQALKQLIAALKIDETWIVHTFEANPVTYRRNLANGTIPFVHYHNCIVATYDGQVTLTVATPPGEGESGAGLSIVNLDDRRAPGGRPQQDPQVSYQVPCMDLARFILEHVRREDGLVINLDIEGAEYDVLQHLLESEALSRVRGMAVRWHAHLFTNREEMKAREDVLIATMKEKNPTMILESRT